MAALANVALTNTFDTWRLRTNALLTRVNQFTINESALYANTLTANVRFVSAGSTRLGTTDSNRTIINGLLSANGNLNVAGNTTISGILNVNGGINLGDATTDLLTITGRASVGTNLSVGGNTSTNKLVVTSSVTGSAANATFNKATITSAFTVSGNTILGGSGKTQSATGVWTQTGNIVVTGNTTTNKATVTSSLTVSGNTVLGGAGKTANATGWFGVNGRQTISTNLFVGGNTTLNGTTIDKSNALSQTLTDGATVNWDVSLGRVATVTLGGNRAIAAATNQKVGTYILRVVQDGSGNRTLTWNGNYKWTAQTAPVLSTAAGAVDIITFFSDGTKMYGSYLPDMR
jgi:hypothetical protein